MGTIAIDVLFCYCCCYYYVHCVLTIKTTTTIATPVAERYMTVLDNGVLMTTYLFWSGIVGTHVLFNTTNSTGQPINQLTNQPSSLTKLAQLN